MEGIQLGVYFIIMLSIGVLIVSNTHLDYSMGDILFQAIGLSPWSNGPELRFHYSAVLGILLLVIGIVGTVRQYRHRYPKIFSRLLIGIIIFVYIFPFATEKIMFMVKHNSSGIDSIDYSKKNSSCSYQSDDRKAKANCSLTFFNYGKEVEAVIRPVIPVGPYNEINFEPRKVSITPNSKLNIGIDFEGQLHDGTSLSGTSQGVSIELVVDGEKRGF